MAEPEQNQIQVDQYNMQAMEALHRKYTRDYLKFFEELSKFYISGDTKKKITATIQKIEKVRTLLTDVVAEGQIGVQDSELLYDMVEEIEEKKQFFLEEVQKVKALQEKARKVETATGISLQDLNVTREVVREGVRQSRRRAREGIGGFLRRTVPTAYGLGARAGRAVGAATLGPFYPLARVGFGLGADIAGIKRGLEERRREKEEGALRASLRTAGFGDYEALQAARAEGPRLSDVARGVSTRKPLLQEQMAPLKEFFDKEAYKTRWTRELLKVTKETKQKDVGFIETLSARFGGLGAAILPFVGKVGLFAALAAGVGLSIKKFTQLGSAVLDYAKAKQAQAKAGEQIGKAAEIRLESMKGMGIEEFARRTGTTEMGAALRVAGMEQREILEKRATQPWYKKPLQAVGLMKKPKLINVYERAEEIRRMTAAKAAAAPATLAAPTLAPNIEVNELNETMKKLTEQLQRNQTDSIPGIRAGNRYDSADSLINEHANGNITLRD